MKMNFWAGLVLLIAGLFSLPAAAADRGVLVKFKGGIGVIPVSNVTVAGTPPVVTVRPNIVRGVNPAGQIWVIEKLEARVKTNGDIKVNGKGLILGGGDSAGRATGQMVIATLICEAPPGPFTERSTHPDGVPLSDEGDFQIDDVLTPLPDGCVSPVLLIRNAANLGWFAVGIPDFD
jgi:hypothetical protein